jgi:exodeoxyribonuclease V alpha subunit
VSRDPRDDPRNAPKGAPRADAQEEAFDAVIEDVVFQSDDGRYGVVNAVRVPSSAAGEVAPVTLFGDLGGVAPGETLRVRGRFTDHAVYGRRFRVQTFQPVLPTTTGGIVRYLGSGLVPGVGPELAKRLVDRFGDRTLDVIATESARLRDVEGIGKKRAASISEAVRSRRTEAEALSFLQGVGLGPALARRVMKQYGEDTVREVRVDPYAVAERVEGLGFRTADRMAESQGIGSSDPRRARGAVMHVLREATDQGHCYLPEAELIERAQSLDVTPALLAEAITDLAAKKSVIRDGDAVYPPNLYRAEGSVARALAAFATAPPPRDTPRPGSAATPTESSADLSDKQRAAVLASLSHRLVVLTGGPGTGKTTTVRAIVEAHRALGHRIALGAPTGRAAKRLADATGAEAKTLHRLLEWNPNSRRFVRDEGAPLEAELVLVDETSMLDVLLAERLLAATPPGATLVFVGDRDQLPPVGAGQVLRDLIESDVAHVVTLTEIFRQAQASAIVRGAHAVLRGEMPEPTERGSTTSGDLFFVSAPSAEVCTQKLLQTLARMESAYQLDPRRDVQVLTPMKRGPLGTEELNLLLQEKFNPAAGPVATTGIAGSSGARTGSTTSAGGFFRVRDKVMQLRNDYDRDVYNGDVGEVARIEGGITFVRFDGREVQYAADALDNLTLAYASTIHKVQGSEFPASIIVLSTSHFVLLSRALLYTAITRAKRLVVLIGDERALRRAVQNAESYRTHSRLAERLIAFARR